MLYLTPQTSNKSELTIAEAIFLAVSEYYRRKGSVTVTLKLAVKHGTTRLSMTPWDCGVVRWGLERLLPVTQHA